MNSKLIVLTEYQVTKSHHFNSRSYVDWFKGAVQCLRRLSGMSFGAENQNNFFSRLAIFYEWRWYYVHVWRPQVELLPWVMFTLLPSKPRRASNSGSLGKLAALSTLTFTRTCLCALQSPPSFINLLLHCFCPCITLCCYVLLTNTI
jgi:hypothetical protein